MINTKLFFTLILLTTSALGMEQAKSKLEVDVLFAQYPEAVQRGTILHTIYKENVSITEPLLRECMKRGIDLNKVDGAPYGNNTILCLAIESERTGSFALCKLLCSCGASLEYSFTKLLARIRNRCSSFMFRKASEKELWCGSMWLEKQRKKLLMAYLCSMRSINVFPRYVVKLILSRCPEMIPSHCLHQFYSPVQIEGINAEREQEAIKLFSDMGINAKAPKANPVQKKPRNA